MSVYGGRADYLTMFRATPDPSVIDGQIPLVYDNFIQNNPPPPPASFDDRYPPADMFQPQNDPFVDRFFFSMDYGYNVNGAADGGRFDHYHDIV